MTYFLAKTDPESYSLDDLARDQHTTWDGVRNAQAVRTIRGMKPGDRVFIYHSAAKAAVVGVAEVRSEARPDPADAKSVVIELQFLARLDPPTTLLEIKATGKFAYWALVRQGRLSTMEAPPEFVAWMGERYPGVLV